MSPPLEEQKVISCNCSYCTATGRILVHPQRTDFAFTDGQDNISEYRWGSRSVTACFCKTCGSNLSVESRIEGFMSGKMGVNVRTMEGIDVADLKLHKFDGANFSLPPYVETE